MTFRGHGHGRHVGYLPDRPGRDEPAAPGPRPRFEADDPTLTNRDYYFDEPGLVAGRDQAHVPHARARPASPAGPGFRIHIADVSAAGAVTAEQDRSNSTASRDDEFDAAWLPSGRRDRLSVDRWDGAPLMSSPIWPPGRSLARPRRRRGRLHRVPYLARMATRSLPAVPVGGVEALDTSVVDLTTLDVDHVRDRDDDFAWQRTARRDLTRLSPRAASDGALTGDGRGPIPRRTPPTRRAARRPSAARRGRAGGSGRRPSTVRRRARSR